MKERMKAKETMRALRDSTRGMVFMKHLEMDELTTPPRKRRMIRPRCLRVKQAWRKNLMAIQPLGHDFHLYVNVNPDVKCQGVKTNTDPPNTRGGFV